MGVGGGLHTWGAMGELGGRTPDGDGWQYDVLERNLGQRNGHEDGMLNTHIVGGGLHACGAMDSIAVCDQVVR